MNLKISKGHAYFETNQYTFSVNQISKQQLLKIMDYIYDNPGKLTEYTDDDYEKINNPVEREVTKQIYQIFSEFDENTSVISGEVKSKFPNIDY